MYFSFANAGIFYATSSSVIIEGSFYEIPFGVTAIDILDESEIKG